MSYSKTMFDKVEKLGKSVIQQGLNNDRVYLMKLHPQDLETIVDKIFSLAILKRYSKIFAKIPEWALDTFLKNDFKIEASIPGLYHGKTRGYFLGHFFSAKRSYVSRKEQNLIKSIKDMAIATKGDEDLTIPETYAIRQIQKKEAKIVAGLYKNVFEVYPFPIFKEQYILDTMKHNVRYYGVFKDDQLVAASSAEIDLENKNAEMTDFATYPEHAGQNLSYFLLQKMEQIMVKRGMKTLYTIARSNSHGMNKTFGRLQYNFGGTLVNNTLIGNSIECMNVWYKSLKTV